MKKSTEFVFQLLITILEPLITILSKLLDSKGDKADNEKEDSDD